MKGQKLFVRPFDATDAEALRQFALHHGGDPAPRAGLLGKLVGELAAVLTMQLEPEAIRLIGLVVASELRRKRIGRVMLDELADLAAKMERDWIVAEVVHKAFLQRVGFVEDDGVMRRRAR